MKVNNNNRDISFNGYLNNKILKKSLEFAAENGALFAAGTTLALSTTVRPIAILSTPNTDKKNKKIACAKSITSTLNGYLITLLLSRPLSKSIKKIDKTPQQYLNRTTISNLKEDAETLKESKAYKMFTQFFKLGIGAIIAAPKAILTAIGTPYILDILENNKKDLNNKKNNTNHTNSTTFKGKNDLTNHVSKIINKPKLQEFFKKNKDSNFPMHIVALTDTIATGTFVHQTYKSKKMEEKDKKPLIYNSIISTTLSIISTYLIDKFTQKNTTEFINKYKLANKNDKNLYKQIEGIKIAKPILIAGIIYYIFIPTLATYVADRIKIPKKN